MKRWDITHEYFLEDFYEEFGPEKCARVLQVSVGAIRTKAHKLKLKTTTTSKKDWTSYVFDETGSVVIGFSYTTDLTNKNAVFAIKCGCGIIYTGYSSNIAIGQCSKCTYCRNKTAKYKVGDTFGNGCKIISFVGRQKNKVWLAKCHCSNIWKITSACLKNVKECWTCAHKTSAKKISGKNHHNYNYLLTNEQRRDNRTHSINRKIKSFVKKRDKHCVKCQSTKNLVSHHIECWFKNKTLRQDVNNLITLCNDCHISFHRKYGYGNNNRVQLEDFLL